MSFTGYRKLIVASVSKSAEGKPSADDFGWMKRVVFGVWDGCQDFSSNLSLIVSVAFIMACAINKWAKIFKTKGHMMIKVNHSRGLAETSKPLMLRITSTAPTNM